MQFANQDRLHDDGITALRKLRETKFGLVLADWTIGAMTGLQLLKEIRAAPEMEDLPFIIIDGESKTENVKAARLARVSSYINKPFNAETLRQKIQAVLGLG